MMIKRGKEALQRVHFFIYNRNCMGGARRRLVVLRPFRRSLRLSRRVKGRTDLLPGLTRLRNLGSGVADRQSRQASQVACAYSSAYDTALPTITAPFISAIVHQVMSMGGARKPRCEFSPLKAIPAESS